MYRLQFQQRENTRPPVCGDRASLLIGRDPACALRLTDPGIRDRHAAIERRHDGYFIRDLTNSNGVHVNGRVITDHRLASGDELEFGSVRLTFEIMHDPPPGRRALDPWSLLAGGLVGIFVTGQVTLFGWVLTQPHPRLLPRPTTPAPIVSATDTAPAAPLVPIPATDNAPAPDVLGRMLKIVRVDPSDGGLRFQIKAQVGDRNLDTKAVAVGVQFFAAPTKPGRIQWLPIPAKWENFSTKTFTATGPVAGYIVRTYYRKQLQDVFASPPNLATTTPVPEPR